MEETKYKQTEVGLIPVEWECMSIGEVAEVGTGTSNRQDATEYGVYPFYVRSKDVYKSDIYEYDEEAIVIPGEGGIGEIFHYVKGKYALHQRAYRIHFIFDYINTKFAYYYLKNNFSRYIYEKAVFATVSSIRKPMIDGFQIHLPPLPEQHAIASALTSVDNLIASLDKLIAKTQSVKQGTMQQLLTGKTRLKGFNELWGTYKIDDLFDIGNGYTPSKANPQYWANGTIPWFRLEDIRKNGRILNDSIQHITPLAIKSGKLFPPDSYILSTTATIGEHALITVASLSNQQFSILLKKPNRKDIIDTIYFFYYLYIIGDWCRNNINAGGLNAVNIEDLKNLEFFAPSSIEEQRAIASALTAIDDQISALEAKRKKYEMVKVGMMQQLLTGKIRLK